MSHGADSLKSVLYALTANGAIAVAKLIAAAITGSGSMLAEAIHSLADCGNQLLLLLGMRHAKRPASPDHPLGHGKAVYFWSFVVAIILFGMGGMFSIYEGVHKLQHPEPLRYAGIAIGVLVFSIIAEAFSLYGCLTEVNKVRGKRSLWRWFRESRQSELIVVFGEDIAALLGLSLALCAICIAALTGNPVYDAYGSMSIGVLLVIISFFIAVEVKALLIGQGVDPVEREAYLAALNNMPEIKQVFNLLTLQLGNDVMVAIKAEMQPVDSAAQLIANINHCENTLRKEFPQIQWLFFEPDCKD